ncbi:centrosomal protein CCDC61 [Anas platyrhynchos]|uniref:centrosomal protein CCDC61 n=1 Tax=Anas platyrhynchos TaxID=8839 RepID=UPI003AF280B4
MASPQRWVRAELFLGGGPHGVRLRLAPTALEVEVEALSTAQRWRGRFEAQAVEELTRRTGNFKRFGVFCAMLEAALMESSPSVSLELLTFGDLQALRCRGRGREAGPPGDPPRPPPHSAPASPGLGAKRYLLLVYCVEFDRIHYPLPLPPAPPPPQDPDPPPEALRRLVRTLRDELRRARAEARGLEAERLREEERRRRLEEELREAREALGTLRGRLRELTAELAATRGRRTPPVPPPRDPRRSGSRDSSRGRHRTPSPAGPRAPRFDPTAFVRARARPPPGGRAPKAAASGRAQRGQPQGGARAQLFG